jgi:hypothetical protein
MLFPGEFFQGKFEIAVQDESLTIKPSSEITPIVFLDRRSNRFQDAKNATRQA